VAAYSEKVKHRVVKSRLSRVIQAVAGIRREIKERKPICLVLNYVEC